MHEIQCLYGRPSVASINEVVMGMGFLESVDKHPPLSPCFEYVLVRDGDAVSANLPRHTC